MPENGTMLRALKSLTIKTEEETIERFKGLKEAVGVSTDNQLFMALIDRFEEPQRVADRTAELEGEIGRLKELLEAEQAAGRRLAGELEEARRTSNENAEEATRQQLEMEQRMAELTPKENQAVISFSADNLKVLDLVCARESRRRKQQWSRSHVINYFIDARFVRGLLNGDLESVSDADLRKLGVDLKRRGKEDFDL